MVIVVDIDGTIDAYPREFQSMMEAFKAQGNIVHILTGASGGTTQDELDTKMAYLRSIGLGECWDHIAVVTNDNLRPQHKADYLTAVRADIFIDNDVENLEAAAKAGVPLCLLTWQSRR